MAAYHAQAIWALCREGLHQLAQEAEAHWHRGETYRLPDWAPISRTIHDLIDRCNLQIQKSGHAEETH